MNNKICVIVEQLGYLEETARIVLGAVATEKEAKQFCDKLHSKYTYLSVEVNTVEELIKKEKKRTYICGICGKEKTGEPNLDEEYDQMHPAKICDNCWETGG